MAVAKGRKPAPEVIVAGNFYCDLIFPGLSSMPALGEEIRTGQFSLAIGGGAFITSVGLVRLGVRAAPRAYVGRGLFGDFQLQALRRVKVDLSQVSRHPRLGAGITVAFSTPEDRGFLTYPGCATDTGRILRTRDLPHLRRAHHVHFSGMPRPFRERVRLLDGLANAHVTTSLDIGWNPAVYGEPDFREVLTRMTIFLPSWRDAQWITRRDTPEAALAALAELVPTPVIKLGRDGAVGLQDGRPVRVPPPRVTAVETTGAGDAFNAGFLWAYLRGDPMRQCLRAGNTCGALSTRAPGGTAAFPTRRELLAALKEDPA